MKKFVNLRRNQIHLAALAALNLVSIAAMAQVTSATDATTTSAAGASTLDRVVVTATKREAVLTDVSLGISTLSSKALESRGIASLEDLGISSTGMDIIKVGPGENLLVSRGVSTSQSLSIQSGPAVGVYIDEMPLAGISSGVPDFGMWDVSRVEMLRGPQGTLYGEGSMAGTIRIISNSPDSNHFAGKVQLTSSRVADGSNGSSLRGMINVPLSEDVAALRATISTNRDPAWIDAPDLSKSDINTNKQTDSRVALRLTPNSNLKIDASVWHQESTAQHGSNQTSPGIYSPPSLGKTSAGVTPIANGQLNADDRSGDMANLTVNYDFGNFSLVSATSYSKQKLDIAMDARDTLPVALVELGVPANAVPFVVPGSNLLNTRKRTLDMSSQELRLVSNGDQSVNWAFGGYMKKLDRHVNNNWLINVPGISLVDDSTVISDTTSKSQAIFGEVEWKLGKALTLTSGLRQYSDDRSATANVLNKSAVFGVPAGVFGPTNVTEKQTTYNAILSWKTSEKLNVFARAASGFRSGGPNLWVQDPVNIPTDFKPEKIQSLEVGLKSNPAPWLVANAYLYKNDWQDKQVNLSTPNGLYDYLSNAGAAKSQGVELELQAYPSANLSVSTALTYTDATITQDLLTSRGKLIAASGNQLPYASHWEFKGSADYRLPLSTGNIGVASVGYTYKSSSFSDISNAASTDNGNLTLLNLRFGMEQSKRAWGAYVFVRNLMDAQSVTSIQQATGGYGVRYLSYVQPRTIGIELQSSF